MTEKKSCSKCEQEKALDQFSRNRTRKSGLEYECKACRYERSSAWARANPEKNRKGAHDSHVRHPDTKRSYNLQMRYNINLVHFDQRLESQGGVCALCGRPPTSGKPFVVDHNHQTGQIRGLIHRQCNIALGALGDDPVQAAEMLLRYASLTQR